MARKKKEDVVQLDLIDVRPENEKAILAKARKYKAVSAERQAALAEEIQLKKELLGLIHDSGLIPMDDGVIRFEADGFKITVKSRDELVQVKEISSEEE